MYCPSRRRKSFYKEAGAHGYRLLEYDYRAGSRWLSVHSGVIVWGKTSVTGDSNDTWLCQNKFLEPYKMT
jgi:hypothetical protein